jgi:hypothetical protein
MEVEVRAEFLEHTEKTNGSQFVARPNVLQTVLERLVSDAEFRAHLRADPDYLFSGFDMTPGEVGLILATAEAAYGPSNDLAAFQHRMCAVASED